MSIPNWLIQLSIIVNTLTCGPKGYSLCARFYKWKREQRIAGKIMVCIADTLFWFDKNHCRKSYLRRVR